MSGPHICTAATSLHLRTFGPPQAQLRSQQVPAVARTDDAHGNPSGAERARPVLLQRPTFCSLGAPLSRHPAAPRLASPVTPSRPQQPSLPRWRRCASRTMAATTSPSIGCGAPARTTRISPRRSLHGRSSRKCGASARLASDRRVVCVQACCPRGSMRAHVGGQRWTSLGSSLPRRTCPRTPTAQRPIVCLSSCSATMVVGRRPTTTPSTPTVRPSSTSRAVGCQVLSDLPPRTPSCSPRPLTGAQHRWPERAAKVGRRQAVPLRHLAHPQGARHYLCAWRAEEQAASQARGGVR